MKRRLLVSSQIYEQESTLCMNTTFKWPMFVVVLFKIVTLNFAFQITHKYPRWRQLDLLLIKYVELEYDALYKHSVVSRELEKATELRVLRFLQVILYPSVRVHEPPAWKNTLRAVKKVVLELLADVRPDYLVEDKLVHNITHKWLRKRPSPSDAQKNLATSDYGTDDSDSDIENNVQSGPHVSNKNKSDCSEVPLSTNGQAPVPTIEFTDDDDSYFVYLQKRTSSKRKIDDSNVDSRKKSSNTVTSTSTTQDHVNLQPQKENSFQEVTKSTSDNTSCVVICSDSEDETPLERNEIGKKTDANTPVKDNGNKNLGVVTFEILDDDEDGETNYMVYLDKEVETSKKPAKRTNVEAEEIVICSDSDDDQNNEQMAQKYVESSSQSSSKNPLVPCIQADCSSSCNNKFDSSFQIVSMTQNVSQPSSSDGSDLTIDSQINVDKVDSNTKQSDFCKNMNFESKVSNPEIDVQIPSTSSGGNSHFFIIADELESTDTSRPDYLVDTSIVFKQISSIEENQECLPKVLEDSAPTCADLDDSTILGGPVMSEKSESLSPVSECRLNESLLEELLLDDDYLLQGRKEFEELEYFLFNDSNDKQGSYLSNISFDTGETVLQPDTFDADLKSLESFLDDSHLTNWTDSKQNSAFKSSFDHDFDSNVSMGESSRSYTDKCFQYGKKNDLKSSFKPSGRISRR